MLVQLHVVTVCRWEGKVVESFVVPLEEGEEPEERAPDEPDWE